MGINRENITSFIDYYNSKNFVIKVQKKLSYFHKQIFIAILLRFEKIWITHKKIFTGDIMKIVLPDNISSSLYLVGFFEGEETKAFFHLMKPGDTFIDIGAHIGYYSVLANAVGGDESKIVAIEPTPSTFTILKENLKNKSNVSKLNIGLFSINGTIEFNDFGIRYMCLNSFKDARLDQKISGEKLTIPVKTLDSVVDELKIRPTLIKIDAESAELDIIKGGVNTLSSDNIKIFLEVGDYENTGLNNSIQIIEALEKLDYNTYEFRNNQFILHDKRQGKYPSMSLYFSKAPI